MSTLLLPQSATKLGVGHHTKMHTVVAVFDDAPDQSIVVNSDGSITIKQLANSDTTKFLSTDTDGKLVLRTVPTAGGGVPSSRTITINGVTQDLSADRSWTVSSSQWTDVTGGIRYGGGKVRIGAAGTIRGALDVYGTSTSGSAYFGSDTDYVVIENDLVGGEVGIMYGAPTSGFANMMTYQGGGIDSIGIGGTDPSNASLWVNQSTGQVTVGGFADDGNLFKVNGGNSEFVGSSVKFGISGTDGLYITSFSSPAVGLYSLNGDQKLAEFDGTSTYTYANGMLYIADAGTATFANAIVQFQNSGGTSGIINIDQHSASFGDLDGAVNNTTVDINLSGLGNIVLTANAAISFSFIGGGSYSFPTDNGLSGYQLTTDGAGTLTWEKPGGAASLIVASTTISDGSPGRILFDNSGVLGEYSITGSGSTVAMSTAPTFSGMTIADATNIALSTTTGTKIGTATTQKLGFFNATPVVQQAGNISTALSNLGLVTSGTLPASSVTSGAALTKTDDTNVTLTLGGTPTTALLAATSLTLGWTGQLAVSRGGTGVSLLGNITKTDDTNVTLTLGGTPTGAVINSTSFTLGWTGTLAKSRGGTGSSDYTTAIETFTNKTFTSSTNVLGGVTMTLGSDATGDIYYRNSSGVLTRLGVGSNGQVLTLSSGLPSWQSVTGTGDVVGPSSSVDNAITRFDGTTGKLIQNSTVTISDAGGISTTIASGGNVAGLTITQNDTTNNPRGILINNAGTGNSIKLAPTGDTGNSASTSGAFLLDNTLNPGIGFNVYSNHAAPTGAALLFMKMDNVSANKPVLRVDNNGISNGLVFNQNGNTGTTTGSSGGLLVKQNGTGFGAQFYSNVGAGAGALVYIETDNVSWDQPLLHIKTAGTNGGAANIRLDGPAPQIEFVETDQSAPAGKYEIGVNGDQFYVAGRNSGDSSFEKIADFYRRATGGGMGLYGTTSGTTVLVPSATASGTLTLPAATDTLVGRATTDTFTNKTMTSSTNVLGSVTMTLGSDASYDIYYRNASGVLTRLANGTTGQFLGANTGAAPSWQTPSGGGSGTVTNTGTLTSNALIIGNGGVDVKAVAGITTDGVSIINLGVNATTAGKVKFFGSTSGDATIQAAAVAGTSTVITLPSATGTLATLAGAESLTNKKLGSLTSNGFVKTSGGDGTLSVDVNTYLTDQFAANAFYANSTGSTATASAQSFFKPGEQAYTGTITWTGGAAPSGSSNLRYAWTQIGDVVFYEFAFTYATSGTTITAVTWTLPTDMPNPQVKTGFTGASTVLYRAVGAMMTATSTVGSGVIGSLRRNAANNGFEFNITTGSSTVSTAHLSGHYHV